VIRFATLPLIVLLAAAGFSQTVTPPDLRGLYIVSNDVSKFNATRTADLQKAMTIPGINGLYLMISWSAIEPARGQYQWSAIDSWLASAMASGKRVDLAILGGNAAPAWLYTAPPQGAGAAKLSFSYAIQGGKLGECTSITLPVPWDTAFLAEWDSMLAALAAHLKATGAYSNLALLRLTGININTDELKLPEETPAGNSLACLTDAPAIWQQAGYRPSLILKAWDRITSSFQTSFPGKSFVVALTESNAFPPIDETGAIVKGQNVEQTLPEVQLAAQKFGANLVALETFLLPGDPPHQEIIIAAHTLKSKAAFQTNEWLGLTGGAACGGLVTAPTPCTQAGFISMIEGGIYPLGKTDPLRGAFIEIFVPSILSFADTLPQLLTEVIPDAVLPRIADGGVVIHAGLNPVVSPGSLIDIYGSGFPSVAVTAPSGKLPLALGGTMVSINGIAAPLIYTGAQQVIAQVPYEVTPGPAKLILSANGMPSPAAALQVNQSAPSILTYGANRAVAQNADYSINSATNGAASGTPMVIYLIGSGPVSPAVATGAPAPLSPLSPEKLPTTVTIGTAAAPVAFAGLTPNFVGLVQVNVTTPALPPGDYPLQVNIGGAISNSAIVTVGH